MTAVLLVEDLGQIADSVAEQLTARHGFSVACIRDPYGLGAALREHIFDVVVVDLLYSHLNRRFEERRKAGEIRLTDELLITGLTAIELVRVLAPGVPTVVWTSGELNRRLHLLYAYEELGQRVFCSKADDARGADSLAAAIRAALDGVPYSDPDLTAYLPAAHSTSLRATILRDPAKRAIWRSVAVGDFSREDIADRTGYSKAYVGRQIPLMYSDLQAFDRGLPPSRAPLAEIVSYATQNRQFFLDNAVRGKFD